MKTSLSLGCVALLAIGAWCSLAAPSQAKSAIKFKPPGRSAPSRTSGAGSRNDLVALVPKNSLSLTTQSSPTLLVNIPRHLQTKGRNLTLCLQPLNAASPAPEQLMKKTFAAPNSSGIVQLDFQDLALPELTVGTSYEWVLGMTDMNQAFDCNPRSTVTKTVSNGTIERIAPAKELNKALQSGDAMKQAKAYAEAGIWHDSLQLLADLRRNNPTDRQIQENWESLLKSGGLANQHNSPFAACCQMR